MNTARENGRDWDPNKSTVAMKHIYGTTAVRFNMQHELKINNKNQTEAEIKKKLGFWFAGLWNICVCLWLSFWSPFLRSASCAPPLFHFEFKECWSQELKLEEEWEFQCKIKLGNYGAHRDCRTSY